MSHHLKSERKAKMANKMKAVKLVKGKGREGSVEHKITGLRNTARLLD